MALSNLKSLSINIVDFFIKNLNFKPDDNDDIINNINTIVSFFSKHILNELLLEEYMIIYLNKLNVSEIILTDNLYKYDNLKTFYYKDFFIVYMIIISKYAEDVYYLNKTYSDRFKIPIQIVNKIEIFILKNINWDLSVPKKYNLDTPTENEINNFKI